MNWKTYNRLTDRELRGKKVIILVEMHNGWCNIPMGTKGVITKKYKGLDSRLLPVQLVVLQSPSVGLDPVMWNCYQKSVHRRIDELH